MNCENNLGVYWNGGECTLKEISVDISGVCADCIYVNIDENILKSARNKFLEEE